MSKIDDLINPDIFQVEDVANDNSCFYRAFSNLLNYEYDDISKNIQRENKSINKVYKHAEWGYSGELQEKYSRLIQDKSYNWIIENKNELHDELQMPISDLVESTHNIPFEEYEKIYKFHAGDTVIVQVKNKESQEIISRSLVKERWGGFIEQYALSKIFDCTINIYSALKYDEKTGRYHSGKISKNNNPYKNVKYKLYQSIGNGEKQFNLLWKNTRNGAHYMTLYKK